MSSVGLYKLNAVDPYLGRNWFQLLTVKCDILVSKFAFKFNLYHYSSVRNQARSARNTCQTQTWRCFLPPTGVSTPRPP
jgi:hypothetical protein